MVNKKCKWGRHTGNTLRRLPEVDDSPWPRDGLHQGTNYVFEVSGIYEALDHMALLLDNRWDDGYAEALCQLKALEEVVDAIGTSSMGSVNKYNGWELVRTLESLVRDLLDEQRSESLREFINLDVYLRTETQLEVLEDRSKCSSIFDSSDESDHQAPDGHPWYYDPLAKKQVIFHNSHCRGIQRPAHIQRGKKTRLHPGQTCKDGAAKKSKMVENRRRAALRLPRRTNATQTCYGAQRNHPPDCPCCGETTPAWRSPEDPVQLTVGFTLDGCPVSVKAFSKHQSCPPDDYYNRERPKEPRTECYYGNKLNKKTDMSGVHMITKEYHEKICDLRLQSHQQRSGKTFRPQLNKRPLVRDFIYKEMQKKGIPILEKKINKTPKKPKHDTVCPEGKSKKEKKKKNVKVVKNEIVKGYQFEEVVAERLSEETQNHAASQTLTDVYLPVGMSYKVKNTNSKWAKKRPHRKYKNNEKKCILDDRDKDGTLLLSDSGKLVHVPTPPSVPKPATAGPEKPMVRKVSLGKGIIPKIVPQKAKYVELSAWKFMEKVLLNNAAMSHDILFKDCGGKHVRISSPLESQHKNQVINVVSDLGDKSSVMLQNTSTSKPAKRNKPRKLYPWEKTVPSQSQGALNGLKESLDRNSDADTDSTAVFSTGPGILVKVKANKLSPSYLQGKYGQCYQEAECFPRHLWIDVTSYLSTGSPATDGHQGVLGEERKAVLVMNVLRTSQKTKTEAEKDTAYCTTRLQLMVDGNSQVKQAVYHRMRAQLHSQFLYPTHKLVQRFVDVCRSCPGLRNCVNPTAGEVQLPFSRGEHLYAWLYELTDWVYDVMPLHQVLDQFKFKGKELQRPTTSQLRKRHLVSQLEGISSGAESGPCPYISQTCRICRNTVVLAAREMQPINGLYLVAMKMDHVSRVKGVLLLPCQHTLCSRCLHHHVVLAVKARRVAVSCPVAGCGTVLDPVLVLSVASLTTLNRHMQHQREEQVTRHPQWAWCPHPHCHHATKLAGTGLLEASVIVQCLCGATWCFFCKQTAHWPAKCEEAQFYRDVLKANGRPSTLHIQRRLCDPCVHGNVPEGGPRCRCVFQLCAACLDVPTGPLQLPKVITDAKVLTVESVRVILLPTLLYHLACCHGNARISFSQSEAETRAANLTRQIVRSRTVVSNSMQLSTDKVRLLADVGRPLVSTSLSLVKARQQQPQSCAGTERLFFVLVQGFVQQAHCLLEWVYVMLCCRGHSTQASDLLLTCMLLERVVEDITAAMSSMKYTPASLVGRLKNSMAVGKKHLVTLATMSRSLDGAGPLTRRDTVLPLVEDRRRVPVPAHILQERNNTV